MSIFIIDEQLPASLARWLDKRGHAAVIAADRLGRAASDEAIAALALELGATVLTKDTDFISLGEITGAAYVLIRCGNLTRTKLEVWLEPRWPAVERRLSVGETGIDLR